MNIEKASKTDNNNELFPIKESKSEDPKETVQDATDCATRLLNQFTNDTKKCYTCSNCTDGVISKCTRTNDTVCRRRDIDNKGVVVGGELFERVKELGSNEEKTVQILKNMNIEKASKTNNNNELLSIQESKSEDPKETVQDATDYATRLLFSSNEEKTVQILKNMNIEKASKTDNNNELLPIQESKSEDPKETVQDATDCATRLLFTNDTKKCYTCTNCTDGVITKCTRTKDTVCRKRNIDDTVVHRTGNQLQDEKSNQLQNRVLEMENGRRRSHAENTDVGIVSYYVGIQFGILLN
eukprot:gene21131-23206_t